MTALATTTRLEAVALLEATRRKVHAISPAIPVPPCLVVVPDQAWLTPSRIGGALRYELRLKVLAVEKDNIEGIERLEEAVEDVVTALASFGQVYEVSPPMSTDIGAQGTVLVSEIKISIQVKE